MSGERLHVELDIDKEKDGSGDGPADQMVLIRTFKSEVPFGDG